MLRPQIEEKIMLRRIIASLTRPICRAVQLTSIVTASLLLGSAAQALTIPVTNADFETVFQAGTFTPVTTIPIAASITGTFTNSAFVNNSVAAGFNVDIPGWTTLSGKGGIENLGSAYTPSDLTNAGYVGNFDLNSDSIGQTLAANLLASNVYTLSFDVIRRTDQNSNGSPNGGTFPLTFTGELRAGGSALVPLGPAIYVPPTSASTATYTISYAAAANLGLVGQPLSILFSTQTGQVNLDNVSVTAVGVPEPSSIVLAAMGLLGVAFMARARRRSPRS